jgi:hypothetical protein
MIARWRPLPLRFIVHRVGAVVAICFGAGREPGLLGSGSTARGALRRSAARLQRAASCFVFNR